MNYQFSHQILPELFFKNPDQIFAALKDAADGEALYQTVKQEIHFVHRIALLEFLNEVTLHPYSCPDFDACILQMPEPNEITEPFFIALVKKIGKTKKAEKYRYLLLEASVDSKGNEIAYLCERIKGRHILHSFKTMDFSLQEFINALSSILK